VHGSTVCRPRGGLGCSVGGIGEIEVVEDLSAGAPRPVPYVDAGGLEYVEHEKSDRMAVSSMAGAVNPRGEKLEVGPAIGSNNNDLPVQNHVV
jgi:hypothetical protein